MRRIIPIINYAVCVIFAILLLVIAFSVIGGLISSASAETWVDRYGERSWSSTQGMHPFSNGTVGSTIRGRDGGVAGYTRDMGSSGTWALDKNGKHIGTISPSTGPWGARTERNRQK